MSIFKVIKEFFSPSYIKKGKYRIVEVEQNILSAYRDSIHWYLTRLLDEGKMPAGILYAGPVGNEESQIIEVIYDERRLTSKSIEDFLREKGITANKIGQ